jgi:hypothetical protein
MTNLKSEVEARFKIFIDSCTSEPYNKICFDIIHIHCNKQLFFILSLSIDITEEGSDVGDDSDDEDFEPRLSIDPSEAYDQLSDCCHK